MFIVTHLSEYTSVKYAAESSAVLRVFETLERARKFVATVAERLGGFEDEVMEGGECYWVRIKRKTPKTVAERRAGPEWMSAEEALAITQIESEKRPPWDDDTDYDESESESEEEEGDKEEGDDEVGEASAKRKRA